MVIYKSSNARLHNRRTVPHGALITELLVAMALLTGLLLPLVFSFAAERRVARATYQRAVAMEIVDGEIETLLSGEVKAFASGRHTYPVNADALTNLPSGTFWLTVDTNRIRLEWVPAEKQHGGGVVREAKFAGL